jgi:hypothetical protein
MSAIIMLRLMVCVCAQAQELSHAEAQDGGLAELLGSAAAASSVLGDGGLQADVDFDRLAAAGQCTTLTLQMAVVYCNVCSQAHGWSVKPASRWRQLSIQLQALSIRHNPHYGLFYQGRYVK